MTYTELIEGIRQRTGYDRVEIRQILDAQRDVVKEALFQRRTVRFKGLFEIRPKDRDVNVPDGDVTKRRVVRRIVLSIRPFSTFRRELNQWTSTESSQTTNSSRPPTATSIEDVLNAVHDE